MPTGWSPRVQFSERGLSAGLFRRGHRGWRSDGTAGACRLVSAFQQPPRDHLRLNLRRAFEDVEDAGVAQHARDRIFEREAVAAVDLQRVVGRRPGDARGEQLRHARFEVAAPACVLGAAGEIGELTGDVDLDRHHRQLVGDAREMDDRLAELHALLGVAQASSNAHWATPTARAAVWMRAEFESRHQLLEALALDAAEQASAGTRKSSKAISYSFMPR